MQDPQAASLEKATEPLLEDPQQEGSPAEDLAGEDPPVEELLLSAVERELLNYHAIINPRLATPVPDSPEGISLFQIRGLLEVTSNKYSVALYL